MAYFIITLLLVGCVCTLKTQERYKACLQFLKEIKKEKGITTKPAHMNSDVWYDNLHRIRREVIRTTTMVSEPFERTDAEVKELMKKIDHDYDFDSINTNGTEYKECEKMINRFLKIDIQTTTTHDHDAAFEQAYKEVIEEEEEKKRKKKEADSKNAVPKISTDSMGVVFAKDIDFSALKKTTTNLPKWVEVPTKNEKNETVMVLALLDDLKHKKNLTEYLKYAKRVKEELEKKKKNGTGGNGKKNKTKQENFAKEMKMTKGTTNFLQKWEEVPIKVNETATVMIIKLVDKKKKGNEIGHDSKLTTGGYTESIKGYRKKENNEAASSKSRPIDEKKKFDRIEYEKCEKLVQEVLNNTEVFKEQGGEDVKDKKIGGLVGMLQNIVDNMKTLLIPEDTQKKSEKQSKQIFKTMMGNPDNITKREDSLRHFTKVFRKGVESFIKNQKDERSTTTPKKEQTYGQRLANFSKQLDKQLPLDVKKQLMDSSKKIWTKLLETITDYKNNTKTNKEKETTSGDKNVMDMLQNYMKTIKKHLPEETQKEMIEHSVNIMKKLIVTDNITTREDSLKHFTKVFRKVFESFINNQKDERNTTIPKKEQIYGQRLANFSKQLDKQLPLDVKKQLMDSSKKIWAKLLETITDHKNNTKTNKEKETTSGAKTVMDMLQNYMKTIKKHLPEKTRKEMIEHSVNIMTKLLETNNANKEHTQRRKPKNEENTTARAKNNEETTTSRAKKNEETTTSRAKKNEETTTAIFENLNMDMFKQFAKTINKVIPKETQQKMMKQSKEFLKKLLSTTDGHNKHDDTGSTTPRIEQVNEMLSGYMKQLYDDIPADTRKHVSDQVEKMHEFWRKERERGRTFIPRSAVFGKDFDYNKSMSALLHNMTQLFNL